MDNNSNIRKFQSPLPLILQIRNFIFGSQKPGIFTRILFYLNLSIWFLFQFWHILAYIMFSFQELFQTKKGVDVPAIIRIRGEEMGYVGESFYQHLEVAHGLSVVLWLLFFVGLVFYWRQVKIGRYMLLILLVLYAALHIIYVGWEYFVTDISAFDKIAWLISFVAVLLGFISRKIKTDFFEEV